MSDNLRNMIKIPIIILIMTLFATTPSLQDSIPNPTPNFLNTMCVTESGNYTQGSTYQNNLNTILTILESNSSSISFSEASTGNGSNTVYGRYYCRGDLSLSICSACLQAATKQIISSCPNSKEAITWFEQCTLLHLNSSSRADDLNHVWFPSDVLNSPKKVSDPDTFYPVFMDTMNRVINESAYGDGFATGEGKVIPFQTLYSLTQCSRDTTGYLCEMCLTRALHAIIGCCKDTNVMMYFFPNCQLRYSVIAPFYDVRSSPEVGAPTSQATTAILSAHPPSGSRAVAVSCGNLLTTIVIALATFTSFRS